MRCCSYAVLIRKVCEGVNWIGLARDRDKWQAVLQAVMKLRVPRKAENFLTDGETDFASWSSFVNYLLKITFAYTIATLNLMKNFFSC
jgi:hypothetical protein